MSRNALISATALLLATSAANAFDLKSAVSVQAPGVSAQTSAEANVKTPTLQSTKEAAVKAGQTSRDAAIGAGVGAMTSGKSMAESGKAIGQAAYGNAKEAAQANAAAAKEAGMAKADAAKNAALAKAGVAQDALGQGKQIAAGYKQDAAKAISVKDRIAVAKIAGAQKATGKAVGKLTSLLGGANAQANGGLAAGYEKKLVIGAKLDASLSGQAKTLDSATVPGLSAQPAGTQLLLIGNQVVRVDAKTQVVLDVGTATL